VEDINSEHAKEINVLGSVVEGSAEEEGRAIRHLVFRVSRLVSNTGRLASFSYCTRGPSSNTKTVER